MVLFERKDFDEIWVLEVQGGEGFKEKTIKRDLS